MKTKPAILFIFPVLLSLFLTHCTFDLAAQELRTEETKLDKLVSEWNEANNKHSIEALSKVYDDPILYYAKELTREKSLAEKEKLFRRYPDFSQQLEDVRYRRFSNDIIRCDFQRRLTLGTTEENRPSYLLISRINNEYKVVGESDSLADRENGFLLEIGDAVGTPLLSQADFNADPEDGETASTGSIESLTNALPSVDDLQSGLNDPVSIPRVYFFAGGGFVLLLLLFVLFRRRSKTDSTKKSTTKTSEHPAKAVQHDDFTDFVLSLFDPVHFKPKVLKTMVYTGKVQNNLEKYLPQIAFDFRGKEQEVKFALESIYVGPVGDGEIHIGSSGKLNALLEFESDHLMPVFFVFGIEGSPDDPKEIYVVPLSEIKAERIKYASLKPYRKYGMFFIDKNGRLV